MISERQVPIKMCSEKDGEFAESEGFRIRAYRPRNACSERGVG